LEAALAAMKDPADEDSEESDDDDPAVKK